MFLIPFQELKAINSNKAALNHYDDGYVIKSAICCKNLSSSKRPRNYRTERNNSTEGHRNHSVYHFKNNYFSNLSQADSEFINPVSQRTEDGKIIHDVDIIAEKMIYNSSVLGPKGEEDLKRLDKTKIPQ